MRSRGPPNPGFRSRYTAFQLEHYKSTLNHPPGGRSEKFCIFYSKETPSNTNETTSVDGETQCVDHNGPADTSVTLEDAPAQVTPSTEKHVCAICLTYRAHYNPVHLEHAGEGQECRKAVTCAEVPDHFKRVHGIEKMPRVCRLVCNWQGCGNKVTRHNYVRHVRECHLKHDRCSRPRKPSLDVH
ncbi:hypothetical protein BKA83DRAFT_2187752 [Pisolithus microcarpus]|nr:hypothetical protein BKA83DRAFT_2187752 [Pisolithus microcarpus]